MLTLNELVHGKVRRFHRIDVVFALGHDWCERHGVA